MILQLPISLREEENIYIAFCPVFHVETQGESMEEALNNIKNVLESFLDDKKVQSEYHEVLHDYSIPDFEIVDVVVHEKPGVHKN